VNPIDELAGLLPPAPASRDLPHRDEHQANLLTVIEADRTAGAPPSFGRLPFGRLPFGRQPSGRRSARPKSLRPVSSARLPSSRAATGRRWLAPTGAAIAVACAVVIVAVAAVTLRSFSGPGTAPGSHRARYPTAGTSGPAGSRSGSQLTATRHWTVPAAAIGTIVATSDDGTVVVTGAATSIASVTAIPTYHGKPPTIWSHVSAGTLTVTARCPAQEQNCWVTLHLTVPSHEHVVADSGQADVRLTGLSGGGTATADQGNVSLRSVSGGMTAIAGQGNITASRVSGTLTARAGQGNITASRISGTLTARAGQGNIDVTGLTGQLAADAGQGSITLTGIAGKLTARADQGSITATGLAVLDATLTSGQSTIDATFSQPPALVVATCQMGSVTLHLPGNSSYAVTASSQMGSTSVRVPQSAGSTHVVKATSQMGSVTVTG